MNKLTFLWGILLAFSANASLSPFEKNSIDKPFCTNAIAPFEVVQGLIIVQAEIDGEQGNFIFDTGSPMLILNGAHPDAKHAIVKTVNGNLKSSRKKVKEFSWAGIHHYNVDALSIDMGHLEQLTGRTIKGLIGHNLIGGLDLMLDFENHILRMSPTFDELQLTSKEPVAEIPFTMEGHLLVIEAEIGNVALRLGLDTGAEYNLLDESRQPEIDPNLILGTENTMVIGMDKQGQSFQFATISNTRLGTMKLPTMKYILADISNLENLKENQVDGLLGYQFFRSGKFIINFKKKVISIYK